MIIYETTNLVNGKKYVGMDTKNNPEYFGSGLLISRAIKKYGKENFKKRIIEQCVTQEELKIREKYWIDFYNARESKNYYNIMPGGLGGDYLTHHPNREKIIKKFSGEKNGMSRQRKNPYKFNEKQLKKMTFKKEDNYMFNKKHKEESKELQREKAVGRYTLNWFIERYGEVDGQQKYEKRNKKLSEDRMGEKNPFYGKGFSYEEHPLYTHVPKEELLKLIKEGNTLVSIAKQFDTTTMTIYKKIKRYWNSTITELKERI